MAQNSIKFSDSSKKAAPTPKTTEGWWGKIRRWVIKSILYFFGITIVWVLLLKFIPVWITPYMISEKIDAMIDGKNSEIHSDWTAYENLSKESALAVVSSEDQMFPLHWGFDFKAMKNAFSSNWRGRKIRGASTISQQVAKNVFLWQDRSYIRKFLEVYFTFLIELIWGKERILEVYLNVAETGPMTFGVEAASQRFYGKSAKSLTRFESARIAAVLPSPVRFSIKNPSNYTQRRTNQIVRQMRMLGQKHIANL